MKVEIIPTAETAKAFNISVMNAFTSKHLERVKTLGVLLHNLQEVSKAQDDTDLKPLEN